MSAATQASSSGWFAKLVVIFLLALAIGLYLRLVMVDYAASEPAQASLQVIEEQAEQPAAELQDLPEDQWLMVRQLFAPESFE